MDAFRKISPFTYLLMSAALCIVSYELFLYIGWQTDDAFISRQAAKSFVDYGIFSWDRLALGNESSTTSFLHVVILSILQFLVGSDDVAKAEIFLNISIIFLVFLYLLKSAGYKPTYIQAFLLSLISAPYAVFWIFSGLETGILVGLISYVFISGLQYLNGESDKPPVLLIVVLAAVMRPDYILLVGSVAILIFAKEGKFACLRYAIQCLALVIVFYCILYFILGDVLPASYYFKVDAYSRLALGYSGILYLATYLFASLFLPLFLVILSGIVSRDSIRKFLTFFCSLSLIPAAATLNGGDWMAGFRFYAPIMIPFFYGCYYFLLSSNMLGKFNQLLLSLFISIGIFSSNVLVSNLIIDRGESNGNFEEMVINNREFRGHDPDLSYDHLYGELIELIDSSEDISHVGLSEAGYIAFHISKPSTDIQGLTHIQLARVRSERGVNSDEFMNWLNQRNVSHFIFWIKESDNVFVPRVAKEVAAYFVGNIETLDTCIYSRKIEDVYRFTHGSKGPLYVCLVRNPAYLR